MSNTKMSRNIFLATVAVFLAGAISTGCGKSEDPDYAEGNAGAVDAAEQAKDEAEFRAYLQAAEQGSAEAQYKLGKRYATGDGVEVSASEAVKWYRKAAEQGHAEAQYQMGRWYDGTLVINSNTEMHFEFCANEDEDDEEALKWYHKAAEQGHQDAKMWIKNHDLWAAEKGDAEAQYRVGCYYLETQSFDLSDMAADYFRKAAEQGHENAKEKLKELERAYTAREKDRPQDDEKDDTIVTKRTELIEAGKYCYIVVSMGNTNLFIWSYLKARYRESEDFRYIKTSIYDTINHDLIFFENGKELYVFDNLDLLEYNGKKYDIGTHRNVFVDDDKLGVGMSIRTFR